AFDWTRLYEADARPRRISLPTYPFAKERYWISETGLQEFGGNAGPAAENTAVAVLPHTDEIPSGGQELRTAVLSHATEHTRLGTHALVPAWQAISRTDTILLPYSAAPTLVLIGDDSTRGVCADSYPTSVIQLFDTMQSAESWAALISQGGHFDKIVWFAPKSYISVDDDLIQSYQDNLNACIRFIKALLSSNFERLEVTFITTEAQFIQDKRRVNLAQASLQGIVGCLAKERPSWTVRLADFDRLDPNHLKECLLLPVDPAKPIWACRGGQWLNPCLLPYNLENTPNTSFKSGGVYVLIGGAGKVGRAISEHLIRSYGAKIVWIGRRKCDTKIQSEIDRLSEFGPAPIYISADASDFKDLDRARDEIRDVYQHIDGVFQAAAILIGSNLSDLNEAQLHTGCSAKFDVGIRLFQVFGRDPLDFVVFFSSIQSFERMSRQGGYAAGCVSQDALAHVLAQLWRCPVKVINWGYFGLGDNEEAPPSFRNWLKQAGAGFISLPEAIAFLEKVLVGPESQIAIAHFTSESGGRNLDIRWDELAIRLPSQTPHVEISSPQFSPPLDENSLVAAHEWQDEVGRILRKFIAWTLHAIGAIDDDSRPLTNPTTSASHDAWIRASIAIVRNDGLVSNQQPEHIQAGALDIKDLWREWNERKGAWLAHVDLSAELNLLEVCLKNLPDIISGRRKATDVLFPRSSINLVEPIYKNNWISNYFNKVLADRVAAYVCARVKLNSSDRIRILEVGAGTGATSVEVMDRLAQWKGSVAEYTFSDVSKAFFEHARKKAGLDAGFVQYQVVDVERSFLNQPVEIGGYDIVIASNVLHATKDVRETLRHVKAAAKCGGILLLNEIADSSLFAHVTFGLLAGWWAHEDSAIRIPGAPVVSPDVWSRILQEEGFHSVEFLASSARAFGQEVIVCESDGLIRLDACAHSQTAPTNGLTFEPSISLNIAGESQLVPSHATGDEDEFADDLFEFVHRTVSGLIADTLKLHISALDSDQPFAEYGLDSIMAIQTVEALNRRLSTELTTTSLFDHSSVGLLTKHIVSEFGPQILQTLRIEQPRELDEPRVAQDQQTRGPDAPSQVLAPQPKAILRDASAKKASGVNVADSTKKLAIVGLSCRYGRADSAEKFWNYLASGSDLTEEVSRWDLGKLQLAKGAQHCNRGGFLDDIDCFDPLFFNISGTEASFMDPQHRIFLEESWKALEDAGYAGAALEGKRCGVYVGHNGSDYHSLFPVDPPPQAMWGNAASVLSARIAYYLNLRGPAVTVDTACSSSLVATHLACQALVSREIDFAIAGGVFIQCTPSFYLMTSRTGMLSPTGRCHTFDNDADGFVPGEGVGVIVIKRIEDAQAAGDHIYGVICGSGINQDGATNGLTAPSAASQEDLERTVYDRFGILPQEIQMVEAHGTGTKLGDPIEWDALSRAFRSYTDRNGFCAIGSVKTNIGHTTAASGVAGLIKVLLSLQHRQIPPSLNYKQGNAFINFERSPFFVNTVLRDWTPPNGQLRRAAVSSFGMSGTNAHLVVEEAPTSISLPRHDGASLIVLSAKTEGQLQQQVRQLADFCRDKADTACNDISFTLLVGRRHFSFRFACVARSAGELEIILRKWLAQEYPSAVCVSGTVDVRRRGRKSLVQLGNRCVSAAAQDGELIHQMENLSSVAELFCIGCDLDYEGLFLGRWCQRVSLPTYPFARERYWVPTEGQAALEQQASRGQPLHPLLHENTSDLSGQRFSSRFTGEE
ncbi:SDR family NAD(P)-dependent oxidoreductase, partial [Bradyrhizobium sp. Leaf401]|uniref:SDR family NAD(P)-dependent oxidoreductase n=1 Tax=Bradyrhizobium sp. Leaf401 TaxID=2876564 RepID=UPI001E455077